MAPTRDNLAKQTASQTIAAPAQPCTPESPSLSVISEPAKLSEFSWSRVLAFLALGTASAALYGLLFMFADELTAMATRARGGAKYYALVPIAIALIISFVHGSFTSRFWDLLGLKARNH